MEGKADYKALYLKLFGALEDAAQCLEQDRYIQAYCRIVRAQREAEADYLAATEPENAEV